MRKRAKKALALLLALSCSFSTYVSAATIANETVLSEGIKQSFPEEKSTSSSENVMEENALEENVMEKNVVEEKHEVEKEITERESEATEENAFYAEKALSGVLITVQADSGVFPKDATLRVRKLSKVEEQKVDSAVKEKLQENQENLLQSMIFDISVLNQEGEEVQPDTAKGEVKVQFSNIPFLQEDAEK